MYVHGPICLKEKTYPIGIITLCLLTYFINVSVWKGAFLRLTWRFVLLLKSFRVYFINKDSLHNPSTSLKIRKLTLKSYAPNS